MVSLLPPKADLAPIAETSYDAGWNAVSHLSVYLMSNPLLTLHLQGHSFSHGEQGTGDASRVMQAAWQKYLASGSLSLAHRMAEHCFKSGFSNVSCGVLLSKAGSWTFLLYRPIKRRLKVVPRAMVNRTHRTRVIVPNELNKKKQKWKSKTLRRSTSSRTSP